MWCLYDPTPSDWRTIDQSSGGKLHDKNVKESWALIEDLALYDNESWNDLRDFAKPFKAFSLPHDASDHRLIELENQVQCLMETHLAPKPSVQETRILEHNATKSNNRNTTVDDKEVVEKESKDSETIVEEDKSSDIGRNDETSFPKQKLEEDKSSNRSNDETQYPREIECITKLILDMEQGLITFTDGIKEVTFKTPYRDSEMDDLTSEGHDLLSSMVILSEDDYRRGCKRPSTLKSGFCKDIDKLGLIYKKEIERIDLDVTFVIRRGKQEFREGGSHVKKYDFESRLEYSL
ncbi:hypothetical protein Tco_1068504 [Tanacetum coccineum]|uniref:MAK10-like protein n=1 Tax=Tanacetum coccineum TaxID=301880 RepID=A0ABQ5HHP2_9ASTR